MSSEELSMWMAYERIEPFGESRADIRAGIVASTIANVNRGKGQKPFYPNDFIVQFDRAYFEPEKPTEMEKKAQIQSVMALSAPKGAVRVYEGDAPAIRRIGKRGKSAKSGKRKF